MVVARPLLGSALANGKLHLHSSVKRKLSEEKGYVFDKRLRYNVRQNESNCRFRDIVVRKEEGFTHVLLSTQTTENNALTPEVKHTHTPTHLNPFFIVTQMNSYHFLLWTIYICLYFLYSLVLFSYYFTRIRSSRSVSGCYLQELGV